MDDDDPGDERASTALLAPPPRPAPLRVARSLADAAPGEMVFVNRRGQSLTARQVAAANAGFWALVAGSGVFVGLMYGVLISPLGGVIAGAIVELLTLVRLRHWPAFKTAIAQLSASQWEEAHAALLALTQRGLPDGQQQTAQVLLAALESLLGQPQQALDRLERVQPDLLSWRGSTRVLRCQAATTRVSALATLGRFDDARRARDEMVREAAAATGSPKRQRGDYLEMMVQAVELTIAAAADTPEALPDDDTLHRWARAALGRTRFGEMLVSLAWAFDRRGDDDMARHLLSEAPSRIPRWSLDKTSPRLDTWAKDRAQAWGIEGISESPLPLGEG